MVNKTQAVIDALRAGRPENPSPAFWTDGKDVFSYNTCIMADLLRRNQGASARYVLNGTRYSPTTSKYQQRLRIEFAEVIEREFHALALGITSDHLRYIS